MSNELRPVYLPAGTFNLKKPANLSNAKSIRLVASEGNTTISASPTYTINAVSEFASEVSVNTIHTVDGVMEAFEPIDALHIIVHNMLRENRVAATK